MKVKTLQSQAMSLRLHVFLFIDTCDVLSHPHQANSRTTTQTSDNLGIPTISAEDMINPEPELPLDNCSELQDLDAGEEETLSFCNLALDESSCDWDESCKEDDDDDEESSSSDEELFQFSTFESTHHKDGVFFCGKLIPDKGREGSDSFIRNSNIIPQTSDSFNTKSRTVPSKVRQREVFKTRETRPVHATRKSATDKSIKASTKSELIKATPLKSRWYVLTFGSSGRLPVEMDLNDIKTRQKKRNIQAKMSQNGGEIAKSYSGSQENRLSSLLKVLSCRNYHATAVAKASLGCIPRV